MFYDSYSTPPRPKNRAKVWIIRLLLIFVALWVASVLMLSLFSQAKNIPKEDVELSLSEAFGRPIQIGSLEDFTIFPKMSFHVSDLSVLEAKGGEMIAAFSEMRLRMDFWAALRRTGYFEDLYLANGRLATDRLGFPPVEIATTERTEDGLLRLDGEVQGKKLIITLPLERENDSKQSAFRMNLSDIVNVDIEGLKLSFKAGMGDESIDLTTLDLMGLKGALRIQTKQLEADQPKDIFLYFDRAPVASLLPGRGSVAKLTEALLPPASKMKDVPETLSGSTYIFRVQAGNWTSDKGLNYGPATIAWLYKDGQWISPVIAEHKLSDEGLEMLKQAVNRLAGRK